MHESANRTEYRYSLSEDHIRDRLINKIVILWAVTGCIVFAITQVRAMEIGWTIRDFIQFSMLFTSIVICLRRQKLHTYHKAISMIILNTTIGIVGFYTLGMFAGGVFFLPFAAVIVALFYSRRAVTTFVLLSVLYISFIAVGFASGQIKLKLSADLLMTNYANWCVYVICITLFCIIICVTILNYRQLIGQLIVDISRQRDELKKRNIDLQGALDEIKTLRGILPLCSFCKKIRDDEGYWEQVDVYIHKYSEADISHGICPECMKRHYPDIDIEHRNPTISTGAKEAEGKQGTGRMCSISG
jgi:hypothetical protein